MGTPAFQTVTPANVGKTTMEDVLLGSISQQVTTESSDLSPEALAAIDELKKVYQAKEARDGRKPVLLIARDNETDIQRALRDKIFARLGDSVRIVSDLESVSARNVSFDALAKELNDSMTAPLPIYPHEGPGDNRAEKRARKQTRPRWRR